MHNLSYYLFDNILNKSKVRSFKSYFLYFFHDLKRGKKEKGGLFSYDLVNYQGPMYTYVIPRLLRTTVFRLNIR